MLLSMLDLMVKGALVERFGFELFNQFGEVAVRGFLRVGDVD